MLGARCDSVLGVDVAASAIGQARQRCTMLTNVRFAQLAAPGQWPPGLFDLMVLSEILYYFDPRGVSRLAQRVRSSLLSEGDIALVHWTGPTNYPLSGDGAVELFIGQTRDFALVVRNARYEKFRLDILRRRGDF